MLEAYSSSLSSFLRGAVSKRRLDNATRQERAGVSLTAPDTRSLPTMVPSSRQVGKGSPQRPQPPVAFSSLGPLLQPTGKIRWAFPFACVCVAAPPVLCLIGVLLTPSLVGVSATGLGISLALTAFAATSLALFGVFALERFESGLTVTTPMLGEPYMLPTLPPPRFP